MGAHMCLTVALLGTIFSADGLPGDSVARRSVCILFDGLEFL
jgi:hypothetical protein